MNTVLSSAPRRNAQTVNHGRYLTCRLGADLFGFPVQRVREIIRMVDKLTAIPQLPSFVRGCLNLRGTVIPVMDLRGKFNIQPEGSSALNCIIITDVIFQDNQLQAGLIVDRVEEVVTLKEADLEPAPTFGGGLDTRFIAGMAKVREDLVSLLDIDSVFALETLQALKEGVAGIPVENAAVAA